MNIVAVAVTDYIGIVMLIALLISSRFRRVDSQLDLKIYSNIAILTLISCFVDFISFFSDGKIGIGWKITNLLANSFCFIANPIFVFSWCLFVDYKLYQSRARLKRIYKYASIPAIILILLVLVNLFLPIIFYINSDNFYVRLPLSYGFYLVDACYLIFSIYVLTDYQDRYGKVRFFPIYLMVGPIALGCILQLLFFGVSLIWVSLAVGITAIYMSLQNEFSYLDTLTGLYNRAYLDYKIETFKDKSFSVGGIMVDVDYFKTINDTYGHSVGDEALLDVARILTVSKPEEAIALRFAGDEFMVILQDTNAAELQRVVGMIRQAVNIFNENQGKVYKISLSLGCSMYEPGKDSLDSFFKKMDDNMYEEKNRKHANN